ncbi:hypothetical protein AVEN_127663-1, partial [Araneus ventricosus]
NQLEPESLCYLDGWNQLEPEILGYFDGSEPARTGEAYVTLLELLRSYSVLRREVCIGPTCNPEKPVSDLSASKEPTSACQRNPLRTHLQSRGGNCVTPAGTLRSPRASSTPASREVRNRKLRVETWSESTVIGNRRKWWPATERTNPSATTRRSEHHTEMSWITGNSLCLTVYSTRSRLF